MCKFSKDMFDKVAYHIGELYSKLIFDEGYVHCDPHPGNLKVNKTNNTLQIVLLDNALYQNLDDEFRYNYSCLWLGLLKGNIDEITKASKYFNSSDTSNLLAVIISGRTPNSIKQGLRNVQFSPEEIKEIKRQIPENLTAMANLLKNVPDDLYLILKANRLLESLNETLGIRNRYISFIPLHRSCIHYKYKFERSKESNVYRKICLFAEEQIQILLFRSYLLMLDFSMRMNGLFKYLKFFTVYSSSVKANLI
ncbi:hypothetical protein GJ496_010440 [Pomphorhynchus laevis]|nr:hypothetical protein GJ496_010440 [Pomphorhynchus laevis]